MSSTRSVHERHEEDLDVLRTLGARIRHPRNLAIAGALLGLGALVYWIYSPIEPAHSPNTDTPPADLPIRTAEPSTIGLLAEAPQRESEVSEPGTTSDDCSRTKSATDSQILPKVLWNFRKRAGTVDQVLENSALNPLGIEPNDAQRGILERVIRDHQQVIAEAERAMADKRTNVIDTLIENGQVMIAKQVDPLGFQLPQSSDPEVEVGLVQHNGNTYEYRIAWGQDATYDDTRMRVYAVKDNAIKAIQDVLRSFAPATTAK